MSVARVGAAATRWHDDRDGFGPETAGAGRGREEGATVSADRVFDPLAHLRGEGDPDVDVFLQGMVFLDIVFTGLSAMPKNGTEVWAEGMVSSPGGIANLAVAASRLGLKTALGAAFSDDDYGEFCWRTLEEQEGVDLSHSRRYPAWHSPVTVSIAVQGE